MIVMAIESPTNRGVSTLVDVGDIVMPLKSTLSRFFPAITTVTVWDGGAGFDAAPVEAVLVVVLPAPVVLIAVVTVVVVAALALMAEGADSVIVCGAINKSLGSLPR